MRLNQLQRRISPSCCYKYRTILTLRQKRHERPRVFSVQALATFAATVPFATDATALSLEEEASIIDIVKYEYPVPPFVAQPVV